MVFVCILLSAIIGLLAYIAVLLTKLERTIRKPRLDVGPTIYNMGMNPEDAEAAVERMHRRSTLATQRSKAFDR